MTLFNQHGVPLRRLWIVLLASILYIGALVTFSGKETSQQDAQCVTDVQFAITGNLPASTLVPRSQQVNNDCDTVREVAAQAPRAPMTHASLDIQVTNSALIAASTPRSLGLCVKLAQTGEAWSLCPVTVSSRLAPVFRR